MTSHLDEGILHELLDGEIPSVELPPIQAHLAGCAECRARLAEAQGFQSASDRLIEVLDQPAAAPGPREATPVMVYRYPWKRQLAWAATLVAAVGIGYYGGLNKGPAPTADASASVPAAAAELVSGADSGAANTLAPAPSAQPAVPAPPKALADRPAERDRAEVKKEAPQKAKASENESARLDQAGGRVQSEPPSQPVAAAPPAPQQVAGGIESARAARLERQAAATAAAPPPEQSFADAMKARQNALEPAPLGALRAQTSLAGAAPVPQPIAFSEAVRRLGGTMRLIEGLVPDRLEALGQEVLVVYPLAAGELVLRQQLIDGRISFRLAAPAGFPPDSLERLKARIRE